MRSNWITILIFLVLLSAFIFIQMDKNLSKPSNKKTTGIVQPPKEFEILINEGCIDCHSVKLYGIQSFNNTGPDFTNAVSNIKENYNLTIDEFIENPPSNVMSKVITGKQYSVETRNKIVEALALINE